MNFKLLSVIMIAGFLFSTGSSWYIQPASATPYPNTSAGGYLGIYTHDTTTIAERQQIAEQKAMAKYMTYYQFADMDASKRNWAGLNSTQTDETSRGRNIDAAAQVSLQNAVSQFDIIHILQLSQLTSNYTGITSTPTDEQGRVRNEMIAQAQATSDVQANDILSQLVKIQQNYANFAPSTPTDTAATYDRQTMIDQNQATEEAQAASLVSDLAKRYDVFLDLTPYVGTNIPFTYKPGSITNEMTHGGRNLTPLEAASLEKAISIFNQIHQANINTLKSSYYGLTSTPTDTQGRDRNAMIAHAQEVSMTNALRVYNSYYNGVGLK